jgi:hypothetical protein
VRVRKVSYETTAIQRDAPFDDDARVSRAHLMIVRFATSPDERERRRERGERAHASESRR